MIALAPGPEHDDGFDPDPGPPAVLAFLAPEEDQALAATEIAPSEASAELAEDAAPHASERARPEPGVAELLKRFDALEQRMTALEERSAAAPMPHEVGTLITAPKGKGTGEAASQDAGWGAVAARLAAIEQRLGQLDQRAKAGQKIGREVRRLRKRFKKAEEKVKVSQLNVTQQVDLALNSPLGIELINRIDALEEKVETLQAKRTADAMSFGANVVPGLWGTYYSDRYFTERAGVRIDAALDFDWGQGAPEPLNGKSDNFSIRWEGVLRVNEPGTYTFYTVSDDGIRFWLADQLVLAAYDDHAAQEDVVDVVLEAGDYPIRVEYYEHGGRALARLLWKIGGTDRGAIPAENLFHLVEQERH